MIAIEVAKGGHCGAFDSAEAGEVYFYATDATGTHLSLDLTPEEALSLAQRLVEAADLAIDQAPEITD